MNVRKAICIATLISCVYPVYESRAENELTQEEKENIIIIGDHPLISDDISVLRDEKSDHAAFMAASKRIARQLVYAATGNLRTKTETVKTPVAEAECKKIDKSERVVIASILRAGLAISSEAEVIMPNAEVHHLGMYRDEKTSLPVWYYNKLPKTFKDASNIKVYICDPMLATGGSICEAIKLYVEKGIKKENITLLCIVSAQEGIKKVLKNYPKIRIVTACLDEKLNDKNYIVPGLGDMGDRLFNFYPHKD